MTPRNRIKKVKDIFYKALDAVDPYRSIESYIEQVREAYDRKRLDKFFVVGFGKAASSMALAIEDHFYDWVTNGIIVTKYGHAYREKGKTRKSKVKVYEAGHPLPDENGVKATEEIIRLVRDHDEKTFIVCLISGGGSALFVSPSDGIRLGEKQRMTDMLLKAGADIYELNTVRKHISKVKGGRLAEIIYPAKMMTLILSDVIADRLDMIASGPTAPDSSYYEDSIHVLKKYSIMNEASASVVKFLQKGAEGLIPETPKAGDRIFERLENIIIGNNEKALLAAKDEAETMGMMTELISSELSGEAREAGRWLAEKALEIKRNAERMKRSRCLLSGGETTVTVKGNGKGGRNMELALSFAKEIEGIDGIALLSAGTDGTDGPTDAAGAIVDGNTMIRAQKKGLNPDEYLQNNDTYPFFKKTGGLFITGPTKTNVMDLQIIIID